MHDTAMMLGALGWTAYDGKAEVITPYFGASGTGQINVIFPVTPQDGATLPAVASAADGYTRRHAALSRDSDASPRHPLHAQPRRRDRHDGAVPQPRRHDARREGRSRQQVFPTGGMRVLAYPAAHSAVADGRRDYAFVLPQPAHGPRAQRGGAPGTQDMR